MSAALHITSGDRAGEILRRSGVPGEVFVWHDILYDGPRKPGRPDDAILGARAQFLEQETAGGLDRQFVLKTLKDQYKKLATARQHQRIVLWFDACLFDQSMLAHILTCLEHRRTDGVKLVCVDAFPGIVPFHGLGQLRPSQMASLFERRRPVTDAQFRFARTVDKAFATQDPALLAELSRQTGAPLPWVPAAVKRWLEERPDPSTGLGRLASMALAAVRDGCDTPADILAAVAAAETPPQYWGDTTLWATINALADHTPPLVWIDGPVPRLPQWEGGADLRRFRICVAPAP